MLPQCQLPPCSNKEEGRPLASWDPIIWIQKAPMKNVFTSFSGPNVLGLHGALVVKILDSFSQRRILVFFP